MATRIILRNDTTANWNIHNPILAEGEIGIEFLEDGTTKLKVGNGENVWSRLPYTAGGTEETDLSGILDIVNSYSDRIGTAEQSATSAIELNQQLSANFAAHLTTSDETFQDHEARLTSLTNSLEETNTAYQNADTSLKEDLQKEIQDERSRIDVWLDAGNPPETPTTAEFVDARIGIGGTSYGTVGEHIRTISHDLDSLKNNLSGALGKEIPDGLYYEGNQLYLTADGEIISDPVTVIGGSGSGGSGGAAYTVSLKALTDRTLKTTADQQCILKYSYSSVDEDGYPDGNGIGTITVNSRKVATISVPQGDNEFDVTAYLSTGTNSIKIQVENSEGLKRSLSYSVTVLVLSVSSNFPSMGIYDSGKVSLSYTVSGEGEKTAHFLMDGREILTETFTTTTSRMATLPDKLDGLPLTGAHILELYAEAPANEAATEYITSNTLCFGLLYRSATEANPSILFMPYGDEKIEQGTTLTFSYLVYDPNSGTADITLNIYNTDGGLYSSSTLQVDSSAQKWVVQEYPAGDIKFEIVCGRRSSSQTLHITPSSFNREIITDGCVLNFNANGRSNNESNPAQWSQDNINASFEGFGWASVDGWIDTDSGKTALRFLPGDTMEIGYKPFETNFKTNGFTVEAEFETHNVNSGDSLVMEAFKEGIGLSITAQKALLASQQKSVSVQFKEDSRVRISFVVEPATVRRMVYVYVNGVICGVIQYAENDIFQQNGAMPISIGSQSCGLDLFSLRIYNKGFTQDEILNNFICDRSTLAERIEADRRNDIYQNGLITTESLPASIPYFIFQITKLPTYKGDKQKGNLIHVNPLYPNRSFSATNVEFNVQGTSSQGYPIKNYKAKMKSGLTYTESGEEAAGFPVFEEGIESKVFCFKADFASSEQANNACLIDYYETLSPYKNPAQEENPLVRTGIRAFPSVVFFQEIDENGTELSTPTFIGKYNAQDDKDNENLFGFDLETYPNCQCVEFCNNISGRTLFTKSDYEEVKIDSDTQKEVLAWTEDFEFRFPEDRTDITDLKRVTDWVVSTNRDAATDEPLPSTATYPHYISGANTQFTEDTIEYRLSKFKAEFDQYFIKDPIIYYYVFTEVFILADSRAKNMFLTTFDGTLWFPIQYDFDTAIGINNEGALTYTYSLEDTDHPEGSDVFTGQNSVLWNNVRDCFGDEIRAMYQSLRGGTKFNYETINTKMCEHQEVWPEALWNTDEYNKYVEPYFWTKSDEHPNGPENYLHMLQGNKVSQRDWWLYNAFQYRDSKYNTGDAISNFITLRLYARDNLSDGKTPSFTITPYADTCLRVKFGAGGSSYGGARVMAGETATFAIQGGDSDTNVNDLETYLYSANRIAKIEGLTDYYIGLINIGSATKLQELVVGEDSEDFANYRLESLEIGSNELLAKIDVSNCMNEKFISFDASGCHGLREVLAKGTKLTSVGLPNGGHLETLRLPATITNLTIRNQKNLKELLLQGNAAIQNLFLEGVRLIDIAEFDFENFIQTATALTYVRLSNVEWNATDETSLLATISTLAACKGLDSNGDIINKASVSGRVYVDKISQDTLETINDQFPELVVVVSGEAQYFIRYVNYDNSVLYRYVAPENSTAIDPVIQGKISTPARPNLTTEEGTEVGRFTYIGWQDLPQNINRSYTVIAQYSGEYYVTFYNTVESEDNDVNAKTWSAWIKEGEAAEPPTTFKPYRNKTAQYSYTFSHWNPDPSNITGEVFSFRPEFTETLREYRVRFFAEQNRSALTLPNGNTELTLQYGSVVSEASVPAKENIYKIINGEKSPYYEFQSWTPNLETPITGDTDYYAVYVFSGQITDSWATIAQACVNGNTEKYGYGGTKPLSVKITNASGQQEELVYTMEIVGKDYDKLTQVNSSYNNGKQTAALTFIAKELSSYTSSFTRNQKPIDYGTGTVWEGHITDNICTDGGFELSGVNRFLNNSFLNGISTEVSSYIQSVRKISDGGTLPTKDGILLGAANYLLWLPSLEELGLTAVGTNAGQLPEGQTQGYPIYTTDESRCKTVNGVNNTYFTRSTRSETLYQIKAIDSAGNSTNVYDTSLSPLAIGFCL